MHLDLNLKFHTCFASHSIAESIWPLVSGAVKDFGLTISLTILDAGREKLLKLD
jgi:hypothetical protein